MSAVRHVGLSDFQASVVRAEKPVLVDFYATWCMPCQVLAPVLERIADRYSGRLEVLKVNVDEEPALAAMHQVSGIPTLKLFKDGSVVDTIVGLAPPATLEAKLERVVAPKPLGAGV
jgi:thioredoxin 1